MEEKETVEVEVYATVTYHTFIEVKFPVNATTNEKKKLIREEATLRLTPIIDLKHLSVEVETTIEQQGEEEDLEEIFYL